MSRNSRQESYIQEIEILREKMIAAAHLYGINHPKVLSYSQQIDEKHNFLLDKKVQKN
jgi:hypothetical protein